MPSYTLKKYTTGSIYTIGFFVALLLLGIWIHKDFGLSIDEPIQRTIGLTSLAYLANLFNIRFLLGDAQPLADPSSVFLAQRDRDYGVAFELPAEFLIKVLGLQDANAYFFRHLLTFLVFYAAIFFFYKLVKLRYQDWRIGLLGATLLILSPRIFGDGFFNDKDLVFMSAFVIAIYTLVCFVLKPKISTAIWHALACAIAIDLRLMAVIVPAATIAILIVLTLRKELTLTKCVAYAATYLILMGLLVVTFWPWLWLDPLGNFVIAFQNMARFRHPVDMYFMNNVVNAAKLPWYYIPVWIGITTPILYLALFLVGSAITLRTFFTNLFSKARTLWTNNGQLQDLLFLGLFLAPLIAVIALHSILYNGWRQMYFIYPAFLLVSLRGLVGLWHVVNHKPIARRAFIAVIAICMGYTGYWMVRWHPYQYLYFNVFAGQYAKKFDVDYWAVAYRPLLEKIVGQDPQGVYSIFPIWWMWQVNYFVSTSALPTKDQARIINNRSENCSDYVITILKGNYKQYSEKKEFEVFDELKIDGQMIYTTFKRKIPLYEYYSPATGKPIDFASGHTQCFLKSGWASNNEDWGVWSTSKEAKLNLFMPKDKPRYLVMNLRGFINDKQPSQTLEISINGEPQKKLALTRFEDNVVKIAIPPSAYGKEWIEIDLKIPTANSPKTLGISPDDRALGIGLKSVVFE